MPVVVDYISGQPVLHNHTEFPSTSGFTMDGEIDMQDNAIIMLASNGTRWRVQIADDGALTTEQIITGAGTPFGLLLTITNAA